jgi:hypothetical protein
MKKADHKDRHFSWCGYRDSNSGPLPWQGSALTTELHPRAEMIIAKKRSVFKSKKRDRLLLEVWCLLALRLHA